MKRSRAAPYHLPRGLATAMILGSLAACSLAPPKPWEKDLLAKPSMAMQGDPLELRFRDQVYGSKENSSGGNGVGGGGCGCN